jgi:hypothetical protein
MDEWNRPPKNVLRVRLDFSSVCPFGNRKHLRDSSGKRARKGGNDPLAKRG